MGGCGGEEDGGVGLGTVGVVVVVVACVFSVADPWRFLKNWLLQSATLRGGMRGH